MKKHLKELYTKIMAAFQEISQVDYDGIEFSDLTLKLNENTDLQIERHKERITIGQSIGLNPIPSNIINIEISPLAYTMTGRMLSVENINQWIRVTEDHDIEVPDRWRTFSDTDSTHRFIIWDTERVPSYIVFITFTFQLNDEFITKTVAYNCKRYTLLYVDSDDPDSVKPYIYESNDDFNRSIDHFTDLNMRHIRRLFTFAVF
jgi:hypothetical protein